jgi:hypothetical protein
MKHLLLIAAALALTACDYTEVEREIGYKGKARINPWLAAERFVDHLDRHVRSVISWTDPQANDAVWILPASILGNESFTRRMEEWVEEGGHLILLVEFADEETNDWAEDHTPPVLEKSFLSMMARKRFDFKPPAAAKEDTSTEEIIFNDRSFKVDAKTRASVAVDGGKPGVFASQPFGYGRITVVTDGRLFRNRWIGDNDHAALLDALVDATTYKGTVGFMRGSGLSLWALLREHLGPVLLGFGLWVMFWLWKNLTRFGPLAAAAVPPVMRGYEYHLEALGHFQWRLDRAVSLLAPLRQQVAELGQRTSARVGRRDEDYHQFLADRAGLPRERVDRALADGAPADPAILTRTAADLQLLLKVLHHPSQP